MADEPTVIKARRPKTGNNWQRRERVFIKKAQHERIHDKKKRPKRTPREKRDDWKCSGCGAWLPEELIRCDKCSNLRESSVHVEIEPTSAQNVQI